MTSNVRMGPKDNGDHPESTPLCRYVFASSADIQVYCECRPELGRHYLVRGRNVRQA